VVPREREDLYIKLRLEGEMAKKFNAIKREWGLKSKSEVIRKLIEYSYQELVQEEK